MLNQTFDLFDRLGASDTQLDFPVIYASALKGYAGTEPDVSDGDVLPLLEAIIEHVPAPDVALDGSLQLQVSSLDYNSYVGVLGIGRISRGVVKANSRVSIISHDGSAKNAQLTHLYGFDGLVRIPIEEAGAGDIVVFSGIDDLQISDTVCARGELDGLPPLLIDEPTISMVFQVNKSPFAGREGKFLTSRQIQQRLDQELKHNVALRVEETGDPDKFRVSGRGLLHLGILLENMRREGYELSVGRRQVIEKVIDGLTCEPIELLTVDVNEESIGPVLELLGSRGGEILSLDKRGDRMHVECDIPARGLIGLRSRMLTATAGQAVMYHSFQRYAPLRAIDHGRSNGVMVATETGTVKTYALLNLSERGIMFVKPQDHVYAGQIVGENSRENDLGVNVAKGKAFSNVRESSKEATVVLKAPRTYSLEAALEYVESDELVEITPASIRLRKILLNEGERKRAGRSEKSRAKAASRAG